MRTVPPPSLLGVEYGDPTVKLTKAERAALQRAADILRAIDDRGETLAGIDWVDGADQRTDLVIADHFLRDLAECGEFPLLASRHIATYPREES